MKLTVDSIASEGLVYCYDHFQIETNDEGREIYNKSVLNILESQKFDAIPLMTHSGTVKQIARRRLHGGDRESKVIYLDINECAIVPPNSPIIDSIFQVLSNEHHILFVAEDPNKPCRVLTMSMLKEVIIKDYLNLKIANLSAAGWHWNNLDSDIVIDLNYGNRIYDEIVKLAELVDDDIKPLSSDVEVSSQIITVLQLLQPLKNITGEFEEENFELSKYRYPEHELTAVKLMKHPAATLTLADDDNDLSLYYAYRFFAIQNNWDYVLLRNPKTDSYQVSTHIKDKKLETLEIFEVKPDEKPSSLIVKFLSNECRPMFCRKPGNKWPGIITVDDLALNRTLLMKLIVDLSELESRCRTYLLDAGIMYIKPKNKPGSRLVSIINADWVDIIRAMRRVEPRASSNDFKVLSKIRQFRNDVIHRYLPLLKDDVKEFPRWMYNQYLQGFIDMTINDDIELLNKLHDNSKAFNALIGLDELLAKKSLPRLTIPSCGLKNFKIKDSECDLTIEITIKKDCFEKMEKAFSSLTEDEIFDWSKSKIEINSD